VEVWLPGARRWDCVLLCDVAEVRGFGGGSTVLHPSPLFFCQLPSSPFL